MCLKSLGKEGFFMLTSMRRFFTEKGQGIVEYAVLLAFVVAIAAYLFTTSGIKNEVTATFSSTQSMLQQRS
jgi:pilus assembly protein Flp/PilA